MMNRQTFATIAAVAASLTVGGAGAMAQEAGNSPVERDRSPGWLEAPNFNQAIQSYQGSVRARDLTIRCQVQLDGSVTDCTVTDDAGGVVSGGLSRTLTDPLSTVRMSPAIRNGEPVVAPVQIPFSIRIETLPPMGSVIDPVWVEAPTPDQIREARPAGAEEIYGTATVQCRLGDDGRPRACDVLHDRPFNRGFGEAARQLAPLFLTRSGLPAGVSPEQARVKLHFVFPNSETVGDYSALRRAPWMAVPDEADLSRLFPAQARARGISEGRATAECVVQDDGHLGQCDVHGVTPEGVGFEQAVRDIAAMFAVSPWLREGRPSAGRRVRLPFLFVDPEAPPPAN
ncbi:energy transducer TonB [Roseibacterium beibuensis]|uniref:energy transducer TonB n=1 Tax=[Roseibacterium] beibuensis TaxID=1193142 RepID=UPI00217D1B30|nr:energy transducer TonB [Roseibacterium beibuensis]MCS6622796.1 energy transducer TonB [Roseibacterium beibuensis]